jgi:hypothetical protein
MYPFRRIDRSVPVRLAHRAQLGLSLVVWLAVAAPMGAQTVDPPAVDVLQTSTQVGPGYVFIAQTGPGGLTPLPNAVQGPEILDNQGRPVWFLSLPNNQLAADFRIQTYQGQQVLTWAQGPGFEYQTPGVTTDYIYDNTYNMVAKVQAGNGYNADEHEFQLTPQNTALITIYNSVTGDESSVGGPTNGQILEGVAQEIDVATGNVVFEWHSTDHVALTESYASLPTSGPYDYFHINSVKLDTDGNLLISSRNCSAVYKVNRDTGAVIWRLGGKMSDFTLGPGLPFAYQHDAEAVDASTIRIFDNESDGTPVLPASRVIWVTHDDTTMTATLLKSVQHPTGLSVLAEGSGQTLPNGDTFVDWGILGRYSEFDPSGNLLYDVTMATGYSSYRGFRLPWVGAPTTSPSDTIVANSDGTTTIHAVWNGATNVATWNVMGGSSSTSLSSVTSAPWSGLDTTITVTTTATNLQLVAMDSNGTQIGQSPVVTGPFASAAPVITSQPVSLTIVQGDSAVFRVAATGGNLTYNWNPPGISVGGGSLSGFSSPNLLILGATPANSGAWTCTITNSAGSVTTVPAYLNFTSTNDVGHLINVSCRSLVGTGSNELITGFAVGGLGASGSEPVLIRASGPALTQFGVTGTLPDPELQLFALASGSSLEATNTGWAGNPVISSAAANAGAFAWSDPSSADSALVESLAVGPYTANISGAGGDSGVALAEVYDETPAGTFTPSTPHLVNVSARAAVGTNGNVLIAGFVIGGSTPKTVLIRASGPALDQFGLTGTLSNPELQLYGVSGGTATLMASNNAWGGDTEISFVAARVGAFAWTDPTSADCALLVTLYPGAYTANVTGINGASGVALVEVYEVPPLPPGPE